MKLIPQSIEVLSPFPKDMLKRLEVIGRVCYKSEEKITEESSVKFVKNLIKMRHESVLEHVSMTVRFITDRGISHEIVRHRLASYSQESTRYCNYGNKDMEFIDNGLAMPIESYEVAERRYKEIVDVGIAPQMARSVLPNALKTEIVMTANLREWRHFFRLRCSKKAHPQMRELATSLLAYCKRTHPVVFADITHDEMPYIGVKEAI
jgi:thymidylate synthase (FAD)